ncbi:hypothetical protein CH273_12070 [Rhodococcus sp. 05-339-2]|uniref:hypothetical protein n=1 Tax=Rhodococcoides fascians TaxID=1828 RepID=UPI00050CD28B|nr:MULTISPECIES: hypothetical protein [Rhodococcus]OZD81446.1 hypothetical protein CH273_12070 [Rhodococcus sp. 05-339-2]
MKAPIATISALLLGAALIGCSGQTDGEATTTPGTGVNSPDVSQESQPSTAAESTNSTFGQAFTFKNNLAVSVDPPVPYAASASSTASGTGEVVAFTITIVNGSSENYDPGLFSVSLQSGNVEAEQIFDSANDIGGGPTTVVLPTREATFQVAFEVGDPSDLVMQVSPGFEYRDAIFTS